MNKNRLPEDEALIKAKGELIFNDYEKRILSGKSVPVSDRLILAEKIIRHYKPELLVNQREPETLS